MHRLGVLVLLFPEFQAIDSLVIRDYYHRYTVDEHSFVAIENIHALRTPDSELERRFRDILDGLERPDLLFLALLFHDVGKGMAAMMTTWREVCKPRPASLERLAAGAG